MPWFYLCYTGLGDIFFLKVVKGGFSCAIWFASKANRFAADCVFAFSIRMLERNSGRSVWNRQHGIRC